MSFPDACAAAPAADQVLHERQCDQPIQSIFPQVFNFGNLPRDPVPITLSMKDTQSQPWQEARVTITKLGGGPADDGMVRGDVVEVLNGALVLEVTFESGATAGSWQIVLEIDDGGPYCAATVGASRGYGTHLVILSS